MTALMNAHDAVPATGDGTPLLRVEALGKQVALPSGPLTILDGVDFSIAAGEAFAIVGASGSGKSTLLSLLAGLDQASRGRVWLDGVDLGSLDEDGRAALRAEKVGFVFQNFQLLPALTALENVMLPLELRGDRDAQGPARQVLEQVGLGARLEHYPRQLSGGEQQRVAIARAFVTRPRLLFADEPTGNLDTHSADEVFALLREVNRQLGTSFLIVTHDPRLAHRCDRIIELVDGRIVADRPNKLAAGRSPVQGSAEEAE